MSVGLCNTPSLQCVDEFDIVNKTVKRDVEQESCVIINKINNSLRLLYGTVPHSAAQTAV